MVWDRVCGFNLVVQHTGKCHLVKCFIWISTVAGSVMLVRYILLLDHQILLFRITCSDAMWTINFTSPYIKWKQWLNESDTVVTNFSRQTSHLNSASVRVLVTRILSKRKYQVLQELGPWPGPHTIEKMYLYYSPVIVINLVRFNYWVF